MGTEVQLQARARTPAISKHETERTTKSTRKVSRTRRLEELVGYEWSAGSRACPASLPAEAAFKAEAIHHLLPNARLHSSGANRGSASEVVIVVSARSLSASGRFLTRSASAASFARSPSSSAMRARATPRFIVVVRGVSSC